MIWFKCTASKELNICIETSKQTNKQTNKHSWGSHQDISLFLCVMYLASWENQDISVAHQRWASTEWLVFSWTFQHKILNIWLVVSWAPIHFHWEIHISSSTTMKCLSSRSLSGRHLKDVFLPRMPNTDWGCTGREPSFIEDFCPKMKICWIELSYLL